MVRVAQMLCPERHCLLASACEEDRVSEEQQERDLRAAFAAFNPWCGICGSRDLRVECGMTRFATMAEAFTSLKETEAANLLTRARLDGEGGTFDSRRRN